MKIDNIIHMIKGNVITLIDCVESLDFLLMNGLIEENFQDDCTQIKINLENIEKCIEMIESANVN